jgi:tetratricopeptide (TPR) repeat protein
MNLNIELNNFIESPKTPILNFNLAIAYESIGQVTSAYSYFLRTAELSNDNDLVYESLLQCGLCLSKQINHKKSERGMYLHAIALEPNRPEAYFLLSQFYENSDDWFGAYTMSMIGLSTTQDIRTLSNVNYPGRYGLVFQKAVTSWWIGRHDESKDLFYKLSNDYEGIMNDKFKELVHNNISFLSSGNYPFNPYSSLIYHKLRYKFNDSNIIKRNFSQSYQDMFVLMMLNGKSNGTYLEVGSSDPFNGNNTALLELDFNWTGLSIDILKGEVDRFNSLRRNPSILGDATKLDYLTLMPEYGLTSVVDYLQLDCDPPSVTYEILTKIPFDNYKFAVITYEHDDYADKSGLYKQKSRDYLKSKGYLLLISNVAPNDTDNYEDWWVHPDLVDDKIISLFKNDSDDIKNMKHYFLL